MVAENSGRCAIEGHIRRYFGGSKGAEATGIQKAWQEGVVDGIG